MSPRSLTDNDLAMPPTLRATGTLRALSLWQPWASLIAVGQKMFETRSRPTFVRGRIVIHAAGRRLTREAAQLAAQGGLDPRRLPLGAYVALATLQACISTDDLDPGPAQRPFGNFAPGRWAWALVDVRPIPAPVPARGRQYWWFPTSVELAQIEAQVRW